VDWSWVGSLFSDPHAAVLTIVVAMVEGMVAGAVAVALTSMYRRS